MERKVVAPYGTWESPFTAELVANAGGVARDPFDALTVDGTTAYWLEPRPFEGGRSTLVRCEAARGIGGPCPPSQSEPREVTPAPANVGTRVHEYGGGAYAVANGRIVYSERSDDSVWSIDDGGPARCIARVPGCRFADFAFDPRGSRVYCVREDHRDRDAGEPANLLVALDTSGTLDPERNEGSVVAMGADFYAAPRPSPHGERLAWIEWDHPNMPWQETRLMLAPLDAAGALGPGAQLAGGPREAVVQVAWSPDGALFFSSDRTGWWNVYVRRDDGTIEALCPREKEIGGPPWIFGLRWFAPLEGGRVLCAFADGGDWHAATISGGELHPLAFGTVAGSPLPFGEGAIAIVRFPDRPCEIRRLERLDGERSETVARVAPLGISSADVSLGRAETIATGEGETAHAFYYPPQNARFEGPPGELPPLVVTSHGGPTALSTSAFNPSIQWWTSRGFAVADVNYRGSNGFGSAYRRRLDGEWIELDVEDCIATARALAARGLADPKRMAVRGGSASGATALAALTRGDTFATAASHFGVVDLTMLAHETHKFESRYTDTLIGPLPEARELYASRSPLRNAGSIHAPVILFQGADDKVVLPNQAEAMAEALRSRGVPVSLVIFEGEGHGFRRADTIRRSLDLELGFFAQVFGFEAPGLSERPELLSGV